MKKLRTAEYVSPMHPDKICDRISDAILDECLKQDPDSRVAIETMGGHGIITITGELTTKAYINAREIAQRIAGEQYGVQTNIVSQSSEISKGVDTGGAGDQGIMVGYACNDNEAMIPHELYLARSLCQFIYKEFPFDGKTQITLDGNKIEVVVASFQNAPKKELEELINEWLQLNSFKEQPLIYCNPAGDWYVGGFEADTGVTGRKLAIDNYGTRVPIGGGAFSGKDATKVDRSGAYLARYYAVMLLKLYKAKEVTVKIAYAIGLDKPLMMTATIDGKELESELNNPFTVIETIDFLQLKKPQFERLASYGHFGTDNIWDK